MDRLDLSHFKSAACLVQSIDAHAPFFVSVHPTSLATVLDNPPPPPLSRLLLVIGALDNAINRFQLVSGHLLSTPAASSFRPVSGDTSRSAESVRRQPPMSVRDFSVAQLLCKPSDCSSASLSLSSSCPPPPPPPSIVSAHAFCTCYSPFTLFPVAQLFLCVHHSLDCINTTLLSARIAHFSCATIRCNHSSLFKIALFIDCHN
jgi:hypothetical protein